MQRWSALSLVGILLACVALLVLRVGPSTPAATPPAAPGSAAASAGPAPPGSQGSPLAPPALAVDPAPLEELEPKPAGSALPTGDPALPLPDGAPKSVVFGAVLVEYRGAQGAARRTRDRAAADILARDLADQARKDFAVAVSKGDPGSTENAGAMPRGVLEAGVEHILFSLAVGEVGGPVDTPRGYWIVKRLE